MKARTLLAVLLFCVGLAACSLPSGNESQVVEREGRASVHQEVHNRIARKEFLAALTLIRQETDRGTPESSFAKESRVALQGAMETGQTLLALGKFSEGGALFRRVLDNYSRNASKSSTPTREQFTQGLNLCSDKLMEKGLAEYRAGQLQMAVSSWSAILVFDPDRKEARRAIETTTIQLRNLQSSQ